MTGNNFFFFLLALPIRKIVKFFTIVSDRRERIEMNQAVVRNGRRLCGPLALMVVGLCMAGSLRAEPCPIVPIPDVYCAQGRNIALPAAEKGTIVVDANAAEPVQYAAERLQTSISRLAGVKYEIAHAIPTNAEVVFLLGEYLKGSAVAEFCDREKLDTSKLTPETDGFVIGFSSQGNQQIICVGGSNPRSVIYGQDALTSLLQKHKDGYELQAATVCDSAKIRWRSFSWNHCDCYHPIVLDAYADARLNCIELRDGPPPMRGQFGYPVNWEIKGEPEQRVLKEAHRRGMFVYGVVCCGVADKDADGVLSKFEQLIALGVDGIYISFDDPGTSGDAVNLVRRILKLAKDRGISHDRIAFLPPDPDYGCVYSDFNCNILKEVPETADIRWFFTKSPSAERYQLVTDVGIKVPTGLFFNWPMGGQPEALPMNRFERSYICVPEFNDSYGRLSLDIFQNAHHYIDSVMVWVRSYPEYLAQLTGTWAWNPAGFTYQIGRQRIYTRMYGADLVDKVNTFDNLMTELKCCLTRIGPCDWAQCAWRLGNVKERTYAMHLIAKMRTLQQEIAEKAPSQTLLSQDCLRNDYLEPMRKSLDWAEKLVMTDFPEQIHPYFDRDYDWEKQHHTDVRYITYWKAKLDPMLDIIEERLGKEEHAREYVAGWRKKLTIPKE
jgi:hypothetical protein